MKRKRRYPRYDHLYGEYTFTTQSTWGHVTNRGGSNSYSCHNPMYRRQYSYKLSTTSLVNKNLQRSNNHHLQPVSTSWRARVAPAQENCSVQAYMPPGGNSSGHQPPMTLTPGRRTPTRAPTTGATTSPTRAGGEEDHSGVTINSSLLLPTAKPGQHRKLRAIV